MTVTAFRPARGARASTNALVRLALLEAARVHAEAEAIEDAGKQLAAAGQHYHEAAACLREIALEVGSAACADADALAGEMAADLAPEAPPAPEPAAVSHRTNGKAAGVGLPLPAASDPPPDEDGEEEEIDLGGEGRAREWPEAPIADDEAAADLRRLSAEKEERMAARRAELDAELTAEEAQAAYDSSPEVPPPPGRVEEIVAYATGQGMNDAGEPPAEGELGVAAANSAPSSPGAKRRKRRG